VEGRARFPPSPVQKTNLFSLSLSLYYPRAFFSAWGEGSCGVWVLWVWVGWGRERETTVAAARCVRTPCRPVSVCYDPSLSLSLSLSLSCFPPTLLLSERGDGGGSRGKEEEGGGGRAKWLMEWSIGVWCGVVMVALVGSSFFCPPPPPPSLPLNQQRLKSAARCMIGFC
jgi:hypothetical protein